MLQLPAERSSEDLEMSIVGAGERRLCTCGRTVGAKDAGWMTEGEDSSSSSSSVASNQITPSVRALLFTIHPLHVGFKTVNPAA